MICQNFLLKNLCHYQILQVRLKDKSTFENGHNIISKKNARNIIAYYKDKEGKINRINRVDQCKVISELSELGMIGYISKLEIAVF